ncbi:hypothetical protein LEP1GSC021_2894 [Leptospira noguchii str. 1993005606]|nr:hypothetical protein LEP1GSC021_2894 [Leptospira noguchii str. 1993005606]
MEKFGRIFSIRKTYFLQVKRLVGTLEKCVFLSLKHDDPGNSANAFLRIGIQGVFC